MAKSYLPEAADSRLVSADELGTPKAISTEMRLRLHILPRILFGDRLFISEGWSLDSIPFLVVADEILEAVDGLSRDTAPPAGIHRYSPIRLETRQSEDYLQIYRKYLSRPECEWSGLPLLRQSEDARAALDNQLAAILRKGHAPDAAEVEAAFAQFLENQRIAHAIGKMASYAAIRKDDRLAPSRPFTETFVQQLEQPLQAFEQELHEQGVESLVVEMKEYRRALAAARGEGSSTSSVLQIARDEGLDGIYAGLEHVGRATYMRVSTQSEGAEFGAPIVKDDSSLPVLCANKALAKRARNPSVLEFTGMVDSTDPLFARLSSHQTWSDIWRQAIALALRSDWIEQVRLTREESTRGAGKPLVETSAFEKLENMLASHCPDLVITQTLGESWGVRLKVGATTAGDLLDRAGQAALVALPTAIYFDPTTALGFVVGAEAAKAVGQPWTDKYLRLFTRPGRLRSSVFRLFRP